MGSQMGRVAIAEFGSLQVEFLALSQRTANTTYGETAEGLYRMLYQNYPEKVFICSLLKWLSMFHEKLKGHSAWPFLLAVSFVRLLLAMLLDYQHNVNSSNSSLLSVQSLLSFLLKKITSTSHTILYHSLLLG